MCIYTAYENVSREDNTPFPATGHKPVTLHKTQAQYHSHEHRSKMTSFSPFYRCREVAQGKKLDATEYTQFDVVCIKVFNMVQH